MRGRSVDDHTGPYLEVRDPEGALSVSAGGGGSRNLTTGWSSVEWDFDTALAPGTRTLIFALSIEGFRVEASVTMGVARRASAVLLRHEQWPSTRWPSHAWPPSGGQHWKPSDTNDADNVHFNLFSGSVLPDEIVPLGAAAGEVAGGELAFLSLERWGGVWWLHHHWIQSAARMYSPLFTQYLELELDGAPRLATWIGGGSTAGAGFRCTHAFVAHKLPKTLVLRRPATDGGPPLVETEILHIT